MIKIRKNLRGFLQQQSLTISEPKLFWIDAICIDQDNVHERNHQVKQMKDIYARAREVYVWLGRVTGKSDLAMDYIAKKGARKPRPKRFGFRPIWKPGEGEALYYLCERLYWRRMWIIQEIVHAERFTVWCGERSFDWGMLESLYRTLKTLEDSHWIMHNTFSDSVLQSPAFTMVWQRAHWRHPQVCAHLLKYSRNGSVQIFATKCSRWSVWQAQILLLFRTTPSQHLRSTIPFERGQNLAER
jgi:hypothetical protein